MEIELYAVHHGVFTLCVVMQTYKNPIPLLSEVIITYVTNGKVWMDGWMLLKSVILMKYDRLTW